MPCGSNCSFSRAERAASGAGLRLEHGDGGAQRRGRAHQGRMSAADGRDGGADLLGAGLLARNGEPDETARPVVEGGAGKGLRQLRDHGGAGGRGNRDAPDEIAGTGEGFRIAHGPPQGARGLDLDPRDAGARAKQAAQLFETVVNGGAEAFQPQQGGGAPGAHDHARQGGWRRSPADARRRRPRPTRPWRRSSPARRRHRKGPKAGTSPRSRHAAAPSASGRWRRPAVPQDPVSVRGRS